MGMETSNTASLFTVVKIDRDEVRVSIAGIPFARGLYRRATGRWELKIDGNAAGNTKLEPAAFDNSGFTGLLVAACDKALRG